jgi:hypothetical protein
MPDTPWAGLAALLAMFLLPFLPAWLFEGPRTVKHWPRRHVCAECGTPWIEGHLCATTAVAETPVVVPELRDVLGPEPPLRGELRRLAPPAELERRPRGLTRKADSVPMLRRRSALFHRRAANTRPHQRALD